MELVQEILEICEGHWKNKECFRMIKTDFDARRACLHTDVWIKSHALICVLALIIIRYLEKKIGGNYTCEQILTTLRGLNFSGVKEQGFMPIYQRTELTDMLHEACGFRTDYEFITKSSMKTNQKKSKHRD